MKIQPQLLYSVEAEAEVFDLLHQLDVGDAIRMAIGQRDPCTWEELDLSGYSKAHFEDRYGQPFTVICEPLATTGCSPKELFDRPLSVRRVPLPNGTTLHRFRARVRRRHRLRITSAAHLVA
ncbi:MAG: hypothetical protein AABZ53_16280 [Planctomycetota bacterium]